MRQARVGTDRRPADQLDELTTKQAPPPEALVCVASTAVGLDPEPWTSATQTSDACRSPLDRCTATDATSCAQVWPLHVEAH